MPATALPAPKRPDFQWVYHQELGYVWASLRRLGAGPEVLEDLTHEVFLTALRKFGDYDPQRPIRPWLFGIAYRVLLDFRRRAQHVREVHAEQVDAVDDRPSAESSLLTEETRQLFEDALAALDEEKRAVFVLHEIDGCTAPQIAESIGIPLNTVYSRLRLGRQKLAEEIRRLKAQRGET
jgi:RNA polymerase sigma-70 factor (ECF subfamily)